jgi:chromosome segregation ATPase
MEFIKSRKLKVHHLMDELEQARDQMMSYEKEMSMLQDRGRMLAVERNDLRVHRNRMVHVDDSEVDNDRLMKHYESVSEDYAQIKQHLVHSKDKYKDMSRHMMRLEQELAHGMKIIEQENTADS